MNKFEYDSENYTAPNNEIEGPLQTSSPQNIKGKKNTI